MNIESPSQYIDSQLLKYPQIYGKSRIEFVTRFMENSGIEVYNTEENIPEKLWDKVLKKPYLGVITACARVKTPNSSMEEIKAEQIVLGTLHSHWRHIWPIQLTKNSNIWKLTEKELNNWKSELIPVLKFWTTHPTHASIEASLLLTSLTNADDVQAQTKQLLAELHTNQNNLKQLKRGNTLCHEDTLKALGWDINAHKGYENIAAKSAIALWNELKNINLSKKTTSEHRKIVYLHLIKSKIKASQLKLPKQASDEFKSHRKTAKMVKKLLIKFC